MDQERQSLNNNDQYAIKIQQLRLEKELQYLKSLNRTYRLVGKHQVIIEGVLADGGSLHLFIPQEYPFREPEFAVQSNPLTNDELKKRGVSQVLEEWVPKIRIFELVELIAIRINEQKQLLRQVDAHTFLRPFHPHTSTLLIITLAILIRVLVGLGSYSGKGDYPQLGDFEAHRNWMSITLNRDITYWYEEESTNPWWRIDYPPVAAYISYFFGQLYRRFEPQSMLLQQGYESNSLKVYMRSTVLFVDILLVFSGAYLLAKQFGGKLSQLLLFGLLLKPDAILIDHGHFQYNSLVLGLVLLAVVCLLNGKNYLACFLFTVALHAKQMAAYYALAFLAALLGLAYQNNRTRKTAFFAQIIKFGAIVLGTSALLWLPWLGSVEASSSVVTAIFPVHRGLYQLKVPNFWCISDIIFKWTNMFSQTHLVIFCVILSVATSLPSMISLFLDPSKKKIVIAFPTIAMSFFMFSYHVHQKSILLPLLMLPLAGQIIKGWFALEATIAGCVGMYHLLCEDGQVIGYFAVLALYWLYQSSYLRLQEKLPTITTEQFTLKWHHRLYDNIAVRIIFILTFVALHIFKYSFSPPTDLPYLHNLLFAVFSFLFNLYWLFLANSLQIEWIYDWYAAKDRKST